MVQCNKLDCNHCVIRCLANYFKVKFKELQELLKTSTFLLD